MQKDVKVMEQAKAKLTSWGISFKEGEAMVEDIVWYQENSEGKIRNQCRLELRVKLSEYCYDNREGNDYKGIYQFGDLWEIEIGEFLRIIDEENMAMDNYVELHENMYLKALTYEGKRVRILYYFTDITVQGENLYLTTFVHIPEFYVAPMKVADKEFKGAYAMNYGYVLIKKI